MNQGKRNARLALPEPHTSYPLPGGSSLHLLRANIADLDVDVVVSSDDTRLSMGGGVSAELRRRGGEIVFKGLRGTRIPLGAVRDAPGGKLKARYVFHAAVVDWENEVLPSRERVRATVAECIRRAYEKVGDNPLSIAFPLLGTGTAGLTYIESLTGIVEASEEAAAIGRQPVAVVISLGPGGPYPASLQRRIEALLDLSPTLPRGEPAPQEDLSPLGSAVIEALRVADPRPLNEAMLFDLPAPIAIPMFAALNQFAPAEQFRLAIETGEAVVRFLASSAIAATLPARRNDRIEHVLRIAGDRPSLGNWVSVLRTNVSGLREVSAPTADLLMNAHGKQSAIGRFFFDELTALRNRYVGHGAPLPADAYAALLPQVMPPLSEAVEELSKRWQVELLAPTDLDWGEGDSIEYVSRSLRGPFSVFPTRVFGTRARLTKRHAFLMTAGHGPDPAWIDLDPLITYAVCPVCQRDDVFFFQRRNDESLEFRSFLNGHTTSAPWSP